MHRWPQTPEGAFCLFISGKARIVEVDHLRTEIGTMSDFAETTGNSQKDAFEPLELTPEEETDLAAAKRWRSEYSIAALRKARFGAALA